MQTKIEKLIWLRRASRWIMAFGFLISAAFNTLHAAKNPIDILIGLAPPIILALAFELVSRIPLRPHLHWFRRLARPAATAIIAGITAYISYFSQRDALLARHQPVATAWLLPIAIDGLMIVGSVSLIELGVLISEAEARRDGLAIKISKPVKDDEPIKPKKELTNRERISLIWNAGPELSYKEIAEKAGVSYNYAHSVVTALKKAATERQEVEVLA